MENEEVNRLLLLDSFSVHVKNAEKLCKLGEYDHIMFIPPYTTRKL